MPHTSLNNSIELSSSGSLVRSRSHDDSSVNSVNEENINHDGVTDEITAQRPKYESGLIIKFRENDDLSIIDNLGHSGSGWTIGPGTVDKAINILTERLDNDIKLSDSVEKDGICIIGAGCIGIFTAIMLKHTFKNHDKYKNITIKIVAEELENTTSHNAGGLISVTCLEGDKDESTIKESTLFSYNFYKDISKYFPKMNNDIIKEIPTYFSSDYDDGVQILLKNNKINKIGPYNITFPNGEKIENIYKYNTLFIQTDEFMTHMRNILKELNIDIIKKRINSFSDIIKIDQTSNMRMIFNCSGLGMTIDKDGSIINDSINKEYKPYPITGHMIRAKLGITEQLNAVFVLKVKYPLLRTKYPLISNDNPDYFHRLQLMPKIVRDKDGSIISNYMIGGTFLHYVDPSFNYHQMIRDVVSMLFKSKDVTPSEELEKIKKDLRNNGTELTIESANNENGLIELKEDSPLKTSLGIRRNSLLSTDTGQKDDISDDPVLIKGSSPDSRKSIRNSNKNYSRSPSPEVRRKEKQNFCQNSEDFAVIIRRNSISNISQSNNFGFGGRRNSMPSEQMTPHINYFSNLVQIPEDSEMSRSR